MAILKAGPEALPDLAVFLEPFLDLLYRSESRQSLERYLTGLLSDLSRKTASDIGRALPETNAQRLQELLTRTQWEHAELDRVRISRMLESASVGNGVVILDDTGLAKKGTRSVGVGRQYSGTLGRTDNCQVITTTHYVDGVFDWPINARLYLPESWARDRARCRQAQVPEVVQHQTRGEIGLDLIDEGLAAGIRPRAVVADAGYGDQPRLLDGLQKRGLPYIVGVGKKWRFRTAEAVDRDVPPKPVKPLKRPGRPRKTPELRDRVPTTTPEALFGELPDDAWQKVAWRDGTKGPLVKSCARVRVYRSGRRSKHLASVGWLIAERPLPGHRGEVKYHFASGLDSLTIDEQVGLAHVRWVIERFYQDAKGELGFDDYEGRLWQGLHRHLSLVMMAHCFITLRQSYGSGDPTRGDPPARPGGSSSPGTSVRGFPPESPQEHCGAATMHT